MQDLDFPHLGFLAKKIAVNPDFVADETQVKTWELSDLLRYCKRLKSDVWKDIYKLQSRGENRDIRPEHFSDWTEAEALEPIIMAEQQRRKGGALEPMPAKIPNTAGRRKYKPKEPRVLPGRLEDVVSDPAILPTLFKGLREMQDVDNRTRNIESEPDFNSDGYIGSEERNRGPLMGLIDALKEKGQIKAEFTTTDAYKIYCTELKIPISDEPKKAKGQILYEQIRRITMTFFEKHAKKEA